jgi:integrase
MPRKKRPEGTRAPNGAGSIYLGADGKWHGRVTMGVKDDGNPDRRHVKRATEKEVIDAVRELERQRDSGRVRKAGRVWTVEKWLTHWVENIAAPTVRPTTMVGYRASVYKHLNPGVGAHRLDRLQPEHLEKLYARMVGDGLKPGTAHLVHRTVRAALNEAVRRRHIVENPAKVAKAPRVEEEEIVPFTVDEAQRIMTTAADLRNGARFIVALTLGLRRGEALGLRWSDLAVKWQHGCEKGAKCGQRRAPEECAKRHPESGTLTIKRAIQQHVWRHGCPEKRPCGKRYGAHCPQRYGGGVVVTDVKSRAGRRVIGVPLPLIEALAKHREVQKDERDKAGELWDEGDWMFANHVGRPVHPTVDHENWKMLLRSAKVRDARLHDARHTAATMLLVLKVPPRAIMSVMGWSEHAMLTRYLHIPHELMDDIAAQIGGLMWAAPTAVDDSDDEGEELTDEQRAALLTLAAALPESWRQRLTEGLTNDDDDGPAGALVPA